MNMVLHICLYTLILTLLHEIGHVIAAKILRLKINKIGFSIRPFPHIFVAVRWPFKYGQSLIYLFSGFAMYAFIFIVCWANDFFNNSAILYALLIQVIIETNPFYSDFIICQVIKPFFTVHSTHPINNASYMIHYKQYLFGKRWYIHFTGWVILLISVMDKIQEL